MALMGKLVGKKGDFRLHQPSQTWPIPNQLIGLEFEAEGITRVPPQSSLDKYYSAHQDGSLRNGLEFVFHEPLMGEDITKALEIMEKESSKFVFNDRTGFHVHLDVREAEQEDVYRLCLLYALYEYIIYRWIGDDRDKNNYCVPWYRSYDQHHILTSILRGKEPRQVLTKLQEAERYMGLNLQAIAKLGSLEFRHMKNTHDFQRIRDWICVIMELKAASVKIQTKEHELLEFVGKKGMDEFSSIYMPTLVKLTSKDREFELWFNKGIELVQEILTSAAKKTYFGEGANFLQNYKGEARGLKLFNSKKGSK